MDLELIKEKCNCCITGKPLRTAKTLVSVQLNYFATWRFPTWGNVLTGEKMLACAYINEECLTEEGELIGEITFAVEFAENDIVYHPLKDLIPYEKN